MQNVAAVNGNNEGQVFRVGQRIKIHPACDWFMRGATHAQITSLGLLHAHVRLEGIGPARLGPRIAYTNMLPAEQG